MISAIDISHFQSHKKTNIKFCPGLNVISGVSDSGKSSILRAIGWVIKNRPSGDAIRNWDCKKNDPVTVTITLDNDGQEETVAKERIGSTSKYISSKFGILDVVGREVPEEVSQLLNLSDTNYQTQHDAYFLLNDSPGVVAKTLNDLVGLSIIDTIFKNINSRALTLKRRSEENQTAANKLQEEIDKLQYLDILGEELTETERTVKVFNEKTERAEKLTALLEGINKTQEELGKTKRILSAEKKLVEIKSKQQSLENSQTKSNQITNLIKSIDDTKAKLEEEKDWLTVEQPFLTLISLTTQLQKLQEKESKLQRIIENYVTIDKSIDVEYSKSNTSRDRLKLLLEQSKVCPTCLRPFDSKTIERMIK